MELMLYSHDRGAWHTDEWGVPANFKSLKAALRKAKRFGQGTYSITGSNWGDAPAFTYVTLDDGTLVPAKHDGDDYIPAEGEVPEWIQRKKVERALAKQHEKDAALKSWDETFRKMVHAAAAQSPFPSAPLSGIPSLFPAKPGEQ